MLPQDADAVTKALVNEAFSPCVDLLRSMVREKGYAIGDILTEVADRVMRIEFPPMAMACLLDELSNLEYRLATGTNEQLQLASLVSAFTTARESMGKVLEEQRSQSSKS